MKEFGSIFQRLEQGSAARGLMLAQAEQAYLARTRDRIVELVPTSSVRGSSRWRLPKSALFAFGVISMGSLALLAACGPTPAPSPINPETKIQPTQGYFLPFNGLSRFTGGPHDSFRKGGIKDGIDIAPDVPVACSPGVRKMLDEPLVVASASGTVRKVGNEKNRDDPDHSIVEIKKDDGSIVGAMHLDQIPVSVGDRAIGGRTVIGKVSCEVPPEGKTDAMHVHVYVRDQQGNQIPIAERVFSGYTVQAAAKEYDGTMTRAGEQVRTAFEGKRCGPDENSIKACGGIRNDLGGGEVLGAAVKAQEIPVAKTLVTTPSSVPSVQIKEIGPRGEDNKEYWWPVAVENRHSLPHIVTVRIKPWPGINSPGEQFKIAPMTTSLVKTGLSKTCDPNSKLYPYDPEYNACDKTTNKLRPKLIDSLGPELSRVDNTNVKNPDAVWSKISVRSYAPSTLNKPSPNQSSWVLSCDVALTYTGQDYLALEYAAFWGNVTWQSRGDTKSSKMYFVNPTHGLASQVGNFSWLDHFAILLPKRGPLIWANGKPSTSLYPPTTRTDSRWYLDDEKASVNWASANVTFNKVRISIADGTLDPQTESVKEFPLEGCTFKLSP